TRNNKLTTRAVRGTYLGPAPEHKAYLVFTPAERPHLRISRHVIFDESRTYDARFTLDDKQVHTGEASDITELSIPKRGKKMSEVPIELDPAQESNVPRSDRSCLPGHPYQGEDRAHSRGHQPRSSPTSSQLSASRQLQGSFKALASYASIATLAHVDLGPLGTIRAFAAQAFGAAIRSSADGVQIEPKSLAEAKSREDWSK
ncbi:unnamed protein product, partial [Tilletia caries]